MYWLKYCLLRQTLGIKVWKEKYYNYHKEVSLSSVKELTEKEKIEQTKALKALEKSLPDFE